MRAVFSLHWLSEKHKSSLSFTKRKHAPMDHFQVFKRSQMQLKNGQIIKVSKDKNGVQKREPLTTEWHDWIDYWSVDFELRQQKGDHPPAS
jgi:hypothetical protein